MADEIVGSARIRVELDDSGVERQARAAGRRLRDSLGGGGGDAADQFVRGAQGRLRAARGRFGLEGTALGRALSSGYGRALRSLSVGAGFLVAGAGAVSSLSLALAGATSAAVGLAAALAPAAGALAAVPAAAALAGGALLTLQLAVGGVGEAFARALEEDEEKFQKALADLAPAARAAALELRALKPEFDQLKASVSGAFFQPLEGDLTAMAAMLSGPLRAGMTAVAGELGRVTDRVTEFAASAGGVQLVQRTFSALRTTLAGIDSDTIDRLLGSLSLFVVSTLPAFDGLGVSIDSALNRLSGFLETSASSGVALQWIADAQETFSQLGSVIADVVGIMDAVFDAAEASGQDVLGSLAGALDEVRGFVESLPGQIALAEIFDAMSTAGRELGEVLGALVTQLGHIAPIVGDLSQSTGDTLVTAVNAVGSALSALGPGLIATFSAIQTAVSQIAETGALTSLASGASVLLQALAPLLPAAVNVASALGELGPAVAVLGVALTPLVSVVSGVTSAFAALPGPLQAAVVALVALVAMRSRVAQFGETLAQLPQRLSSQAVGAATRSMTALRTGVAGLVGLVGGPWGVAIAAGVTALSLFGQGQQEAAARVDELTATLDAQTGALTEDTRAWLANQLHRRGALELAQRMGVDGAVLISAILGEAGAMDALNEALDANVRSAQTRLGVNMPAAMQGEIVAAGQLRDVVRDLSSSFTESTSAARLKAEAARQLSFAEQSAAAAARDVAKAMREQAAELLAQVDPAAGLLQSLQRVEEAQSAYAKAVRTSGADSEKARKAALDLASSSAALAGAAGSLGDSFTGRLTPSMRGMMSAAGLTRGQIKAVERALKDAKDAAEEYEGSYRARVGVTGAEQALAQLRRIRDAAVAVSNARGGVPLGGGRPLADGDIIRRPTFALVGEAGPEVVIPLTKPQRARELADRSGLTSMLAAAAAVPSVAAARVASDVYTIDVGIARNVVDGFLIELRAMARALYDGSSAVFASVVAGARDRLGIRSPSTVFAEIGRETGRGFIKGLTGTASEIKQTVDGIIASIREAFQGRASRVDDRLVAMVRDGNRRLQRLVKERDELVERMDEARRLAEDTAGRALSAFSLQQLTQGDVSAGGILAGLDDAVDRVRDFTRQVNALARRGVHRGLIEQILGLGPEQGVELAQALSTADRDTIRRINTLQQQLVDASTDLGEAGADAMFDAGRQAGRGFLAGLQGQRKEIEQLMLDIARGMQRAIRTALRISSPSKVFMWIGEQVGAGLQKGLVGRLDALRRSSRMAARAVVGAVGSELHTLSGVAASALDQLVPPAGRRTPVVSFGRAQRGEQPWTFGTPPRGGVPAAPPVINNYWTINEVGSGETTANRILTRMAFAAGGV